MSFERVVLGRTGLLVGRMGLGSSYGTTASMVEEAHERGVNYFYWGALRTEKMAEGIRTIARKKRDDMVIVVQNNATFKIGIEKVVINSLRRLGLEYFDILLLGWRNHRPNQKIIDTVLTLRDKGYFRFLAVSAHRREVFREYIREGLFDVFHLRYNAAHRGVEQEVFSALPEEGGPGIVSFTNTRWGGLINPKNMPSGKDIPTAADCYRFVLSHRAVHVAICGPNSMDQLRQDLFAMEQGPMSEKELIHMRCVGDHVHQHIPRFLDNLRGLRTIRF